jgi:H+-translocating NAD(P) transhydrogenase subunit alpha
VRIAVVRERRVGESRVGLVPGLVGGLLARGWEVLVEPGAGVGALFGDGEYVDAGAVVVGEPWREADVVVSVNPLDVGVVRGLRSGVATVSFLPVGGSGGVVGVLRDGGVTSFAMELVPRISRAQSMDALSSQALVSGYRGAVVAAGLLGRFFPLSMTSAGTVPPAQVVVLGAGVAGLQAIATCRRLGAVVRGYDVRAAAAEEIRSVGGVPIELELESLEGAGGYAREMSVDRAVRQRDLLAPFVAAADVLITTAAVPGRRAPLLVSAEMVEAMAAGSVVVDLAAESGGNVAGVRAGEVVRVGGALVWGGSNVPAQMPGPASRLYAQNVVNLVLLMTGADGFAPDFDDEIVAGCCVTHAGVVRHEPTRVALAADPGAADPGAADPAAADPGAADPGVGDGGAADPGVGGGVGE